MTLSCPSQDEENKARRGKGLRERRRENAHRSERREAERDSSEAGRDKRERERGAGWLCSGVGRCYGDGSKAGKGKGGSVDANAP